MKVTEEKLKKVKHFKTHTSNATRAIIITILQWKLQLTAGKIHI